jgi:hypothetical protein
MSLSCHSVFKCILLLGLLCASSCSNSGPRSELAAQPSQSSLRVTYTGFTPDKVSLLPLTRLVSSSSSDAESYIQAYVTLADEFGAQLKYPGTFRFELYEKLLRSAKPKGPRKKIWPDLDLRGPKQNNQFWQDFLRAYEFHLDFVPDSNQKYILEVTFLGSKGKRLSDQLTLEI